MFELLTMRDVIEVPPNGLMPPKEGADPSDPDVAESFLIVLRHCIAAKYAGYVISAKGYCVSVASILKCSQPAVLHNGEGSAWCSVTFEALIFRPFVGEKIRAKILAQSETGIQLTLGFFKEVYVPAANLMQGSQFDAETNSWYLEVESDQAEMTSQGAEEAPAIGRNYLLNKDDVIFSVKALNVKADTGALVQLVAAAPTAGASLIPPSAGATTPAAQGAKKGGTGGGDSDGPAASIMFVIGDFDGTGLGPTAWYN